MIERWYLSLCLLAFTTTGIVPILVPLEVARIEGNSLHAGVVLSAIGAGMLTAPLWGALAQRSGGHRVLISLGCLGVGAALFGFADADRLFEWVGLAFGMGCGVSAVFTVANLLLVTLYTGADATARVGWLQAVTTVGTVAGLAAAGLVSHMPDDVGFFLGCGSSVLAAIMAFMSVPNPGAGQVRDAPEATVAHSPLGWHVFRSSWRTHVNQPIVLFSLLWFVANLGVYGLNGLYPLFMESEFGVQPSASALALAAATALSTAVFVWSSHWTGRWGATPVLRAGLGLRLVCLSVLAILTLMAAHHYRVHGGVLIFGLITLLWPPLSVSSTLLVAQLAGPNRGGGMGIYNGSAALASLAGPVVAAELADRFTYEAPVLLAGFGVALALGLSFFLPTTSHLETLPEASQSTQSS